MADVADYTQAVNVTGGSVAITGTATVQITGTPTVSISGTPTVNVGNTPAVTINSGTVTATISGTPNINIQAQSITVNVALPWTAAGSFTTVGAGAESFTTSPAAPTNTQSLGIAVSGLSFISDINVVGHQSGINYELSPVAGPAQNVTVWQSVPVNGALDTTFDISWRTSGGVGTVVKAFVSALAMGYPALGQELMSASIPVAIAVDQSKFPVQVAAVDVTGFSDPGAGVAASVVLAATVGKTYTAVFIGASVLTNAAASISMHVKLLDGATQKCTFVMSVPATAFQEAPKVQTVVAYKGTVGNSMTWQFDTGPASAQQTVNIGAYQA